MPESTVTIALVYPSLLGTYGDGGNASVLAQRLRWRGQAADVIDVDVDAAVPQLADIYVLGGGEDTAQTLAVNRLSADGALRKAADAGRTVFAVCAGFQILGETFLEGRGADHPGLGLIDVRTDRLPGARAVGELLASPHEPGIGQLTGYENHGGRTVLGPAARPLASVESGTGNGDAGGEGVLQGSVIATYLHGPALARNPGLADFVLSRVVGELSPLDDSEEDELRRERFAFVRRERRSGRGRRQFRPSARS